MFGMTYEGGDGFANEGCRNESSVVLKYVGLAEHSGSQRVRKESQLISP